MSEQKLASRRIAVTGSRPMSSSRAKAPTSMLMHGFPDSRQVWRKQIPALVAAGYRIIAPDLRSFGESDAPADVSASTQPPTIAAVGVGTFSASDLDPHHQFAVGGA